MAKRRPLLEGFGPSMSTCLMVARLGLRPYWMQMICANSCRLKPAYSTRRSTIACRMGGGSDRWSSASCRFVGRKRLTMPWASNRSAWRRSVRSLAFVCSARSPGGSPQSITGRSNSYAFSSGQRQRCLIVSQASVCGRRLRAGIEAFAPHDDRRARTAAPHCSTGLNNLTTIGHAH